MGKRDIGATQSRADLSAPRVSVKPKPRGLTTPAATTATREGDFFTLFTLIVTFFPVPSLDLLLLSETKHLTKEPERGKQQLVSWWIAQLSLFSGDLKSDKREQ